MEILKIAPTTGCNESNNCVKYYLKRDYRNIIEGGYVGIGRPGREVIAYIDLHTNYGDYINEVKKYCKGNVIRDARKADGYVSHVFEAANFIPDMHEINHSKEVRCGRPMAENYRRSVEEMGGAPSEWKEIKRPGCPVHWRWLWGIFKPEVGYKQGDLIVDEKLLGYISLYRSGNYAQYSMLLGHGDYLKDGIMYRLHFAVMEWLLGDDPDTDGLDFLWYCNWPNFLGGLLLWKKKAGFKPGRLMGAWYGCMG